MRMRDLTLLPRLSYNKTNSNDWTCNKWSIGTKGFTLLPCILWYVPLKILEDYLIARWGIQDQTHTIFDVIFELIVEYRNYFLKSYRFNYLFYILIFLLTGVKLDKQPFK